MSGFSQIGSSSQCGALYRRARPKSLRNLKNKKYHIFTIPQLAKRRAARGAGFILRSPRSTQKGGDRVASRPAFGIGRRPEKSVFRRNLPVRAGAKPGRATKRGTDSAGLGRQSQNAGNVHLSLEKGSERYRKSRLETLSGPNPGRLNRASRRPARRDRPCG
jgi:hypothetical protein